jgi:hypothetical protein
MNNKINIFILAFTTFIFICIIFYWGDYLIKNDYIRREKREGFTTVPSMNPESADTTTTVRLPINTTTSCKNMCGPPGRCSITGEQCVADIDCYGCTPPPNKKIEESLKQEVPGYNDSGKLTQGVTPTFSVLTTDIGTRAAVINPNAAVPQYFLGVDQWKNKFELGENEFNKKYYPTQELGNMLNYPVRPTLSGEFKEVGPLASNE